MNGVRRFLAVATSSSSPPANGPDSPTAKSSPGVFSNGPSWPPQAPTAHVPIPQPSPQSTPPLFFKKDLVGRQKQQPPTPPPDDDALSFPFNPGSPASSASTSRVPQNRMIKRKTPPQVQSLSEIDWKRATGGSVTSSTTTVRDEFIISLLASQAVVDSREFDILTSEQIDDLKKVRSQPCI